MFDLEANGLLPTVTRIWCGVFKDVTTETVVEAYGVNVEEGLTEILDDCDTLIGHNIVDFDITLLKQVMDYEYTGDVYDTFLMSMMSKPDRKKHPNCPKDKGPHSLANFGAIFGRPKPEHEEWDVWSPEMLHRCKEDTEITYLAFFYLMKEMGVKWL